MGKNLRFLISKSVPETAGSMHTANPVTNGPDLGSVPIAGPLEFVGRARNVPVSLT